jgi:co-chaperonin GroES (HSP10)
MADFSQLTAIKNSILFQFLDKTSGPQGAFSERTRSGLIIPKLTSTQKGERWGKVVAVGSDVDGVQVGEYILIEALMWTHGVDYENEKVWRTTDEKVLMVTDDESLTVVW